MRMAFLFGKDVMLFSLDKCKGSSLTVKFLLFCHSRGLLAGILLKVSRDPRQKHSGMTRIYM